MNRKDDKDLQGRIWVERCDCGFHTRILFVYEDGNVAWATIGANELETLCLGLWKRLEEVRLAGRAWEIEAIAEGIKCLEDKPRK